MKIREFSKRLKTGTHVCVPVDLGGCLVFEFWYGDDTKKYYMEVNAFNDKDDCFCHTATIVTLEQAYITYCSVMEQQQWMGGKRK